MIPTKERQTDRKTGTQKNPQIICNSLTKIVIILITKNTKFILPQSDFSVKVKGRTNKVRQIDKRTSKARDTQNTFIDFINTKWYTNRATDKI